jgi:hypothetical protein
MFTTNFSLVTITVRQQKLITRRQIIVLMDTGTLQFSSKFLLSNEAEKLRKTSQLPGSHSPQNLIYESTFIKKLNPKPQRRYGDTEHYL